MGELRSGPAKSFAGSAALSAVLNLAIVYTHPISLARITSASGVSQRDAP